MNASTNASTPVVDGVSAGAFRIPTDQPESDGTLQWDVTTLVVAQVSGGGQTGLGYTYANEACVPLIRGILTETARGMSIFDVPAAWQAMVRAIRNLGRPGVASCAISAVDTALWDLKAKLLGLPLCQLFGRARESVPVYGSGGFITYDDATARTQLERWTQTWSIPRVKIKIGESQGGNEGRDVRRVAFAREVIGPDVELFVDANGGYRRKQAMRVAARLADDGVTWFEEPVSSDDLAELREVRAATQADVTAGEYGFDLAYFERMVDAGAVDCLQVDATRCGGYTEWFRAAAVAAAHGLDVSAHCAPNLHLAAAAAAPNVRHIEYFHDHVRIEGMLFDGVASPVAGALPSDNGSAGHGMEFKRDDAQQFRVL